MSALASKAPIVTSKPGTAGAIKRGPETSAAPSTPGSKQQQQPQAQNNNSALDAIDQEISALTMSHLIYKSFRLAVGSGLDSNMIWTEMAELEQRYQAQLNALIAKKAALQRQKEKQGPAQNEPKDAPEMKDASKFKDPTSDNENTPSARNDNAAPTVKPSDGQKKTTFKRDGAYKPAEPRQPMKTDNKYAQMRRDNEQKKNRSKLGSAFSNAHNGQKLGGPKHAGARPAAKAGMKPGR